MLIARTREALKPLDVRIMPLKDRTLWFDFWSMPLCRAKSYWCNQLLKKNKKPSCIQLYGEGPHFGICQCIQSGARVPKGGDPPSY